ncbi:MAG: hypothetical protein ACXWQ7_14100 [Bdellovibrio sp.]
MTLRNNLLVALAAMTLTSLNAKAYIVGGPVSGPGGVYNPGIPERHDIPGGPVVPQNPRGDIGRGDGWRGGDRGDRGGWRRGDRDGRRDGGYLGRQEQKIIYVGRRICNETLDLRRLADIDQNYSGYNVESVVVEVNFGDDNSQLSLLVDERVVDTARSSQGTVMLQPPYSSVLDRDIRNLQVDIRGEMQIQSVTINLRANDRYDRPDRPDRPDQGMDIPLYVNRRLLGNDRLDLTQYIDVNQYRGFRIQQIVIDATPVYNTALIDVLINGFTQGQTLQVDRSSYSQIVRPNNAVLGQGADSIVLYTRGDLDIRNITLRLSR